MREGERERGSESKERERKRESKREKERGRETCISGHMNYTQVGLGMLETAGLSLKNKTLCFVIWSNVHVLLHHMTERWSLNC